MSEFKKHNLAVSRSMFEENDIVWFRERLGQDESMAYPSIQLDHLVSESSDTLEDDSEDVIRRFSVTKPWHMAVVENMMKQNDARLASSRRQFIPRYNIKKFKSLMQDPMAILNQGNGEQWVYQNVVPQEQLLFHRAHINGEEDSPSDIVPDLLLDIPFDTFSLPELAWHHFRRLYEKQAQDDSIAEQMASFSPVGELNYICNAPSINRKLDAVVFDGDAKESILGTTRRETQEGTMFFARFINGLSKTNNLVPTSGRDHAIVFSGSTSNGEKERLFQQFMSLFVQNFSQERQIIPEANLVLSVGLELLGPFGITLSSAAALQTHLKHVDLHLHPDDGSVCGANVHVGHAGQLGACNWVKHNVDEMLSNWRYEILFILANDLAQDNYTSHNQKYAAVVRNLSKKYGVLNGLDDYMLFNGFTSNRKVGMEYNLWDVLRWMRRIGMMESEVDLVLCSLSACLLLFNWNYADHAKNSREYAEMISSLTGIEKQSLEDLENNDDAQRIRNALFEHLYTAAIDIIVNRINSSIEVIFQNELSSHGSSSTSHVNLIYLPDIPEDATIDSSWKLFGHFLNHAALQSNLEQELQRIDRMGYATPASKRVLTHADAYSKLPLYFDQYLVNNMGENLSVDAAATEISKKLDNQWTVGSHESKHMRLTNFIWNQPILFNANSMLSHYQDKNCMAHVRSLMKTSPHANSFIRVETNTPRTPWSLLHTDMHNLRSKLNCITTHTVHCFSHAASFPFPVDAFHRFQKHMNESGIGAVCAMHFQGLTKTMALDDLTRLVSKFDDDSNESIETNVLSSFCAKMSLDPTLDLKLSHDHSSLLLGRKALQALNVWSNDHSEMSDSNHASTLLSETVKPCNVDPWYLHVCNRSVRGSVLRDDTEEIHEQGNIHGDVDDDSLYEDWESDNDQEHQIFTEDRLTESDVPTRVGDEHQVPGRPEITDIFKNTEIEPLVQFEPNAASLVELYERTTANGIFPPEVLRIIQKIYKQDDDIRHVELFFLLSYAQRMLSVLCCSPSEAQLVENPSSAYVMAGYVENMGPLFHSLEYGDIDTENNLKFCQRFVLEILCVLFIFTSFDRNRLLLDSKVLESTLDFVQMIQLHDVLVLVACNHVMLNSKERHGIPFLSRQDKTVRQIVALMCSCMLKDLCLTQSDTCDHLVCHDGGRSYWNIFGMMGRAIHEYTSMTSTRKNRSSLGIQVAAYGMMVNMFQVVVDHILTDHSLVRELALTYEDAVNVHCTSATGSDDKKAERKRKLIRIGHMMKAGMRVLLELITVADDVIKEATEYEVYQECSEHEVEYLPIYDRAVPILKKALVHLTDNRQLQRAMSIVAKLSHVFGSRFREEELLHCLLQRLLDCEYYNCNRIMLAMLADVDEVEHVASSTKRVRSAGKHRSSLLPRKRFVSMIGDARDMGITYILCINILRGKSSGEEESWAAMSAMTLVALCRQDRRIYSQFEDIVQQIGDTIVSRSIIVMFKAAKSRCCKDTIQKFVERMLQTTGAHQMSIETHCYNALRIMLQNDYSSDIENQLP